MKKLFLVFVLLAGLDLFGGYDVGNIAVVQGGPNIASGLIGAQEQIAGTEFYKTHADIYDFIVVFTTYTPQMNMQQGLAIQGTVTGIGRDGSYSPYGPASKWGSAGRLIGGTRMCHIDQYPDDPDAPISTNPLSPYAGDSTVELLAHEFSHYWLAALDFKKAGDTVANTGLRGWESDAANQHWSGYFSSGPSVMYGSNIVDNGDGSFTYIFDQPRRYGQLDQYAMGLRAPEEVSPVFYLCSSSKFADCTQGDPSVPSPKNNPPNTVTGRYKMEVTIEDIIRAMGPRKPAVADAPKHWNVAFVIINQPGVDPFPAQLNKLDTLRVRFQEWFSWATDGRASICTELDGDCSETEQPDEGDILRDNEANTDGSVTSDDDIITTDDIITDDADNVQTTDNGQAADNGSAPDKNGIPDTSSQSDNSVVSQDDDVITEEAGSSGCGCSLLL